MDKYNLVGNIILYRFRFSLHWVKGWAFFLNRQD